MKQKKEEGHSWNICVGEWLALLHQIWAMEFSKYRTLVYGALGSPPRYLPLRRLRNTVGICHLGLGGQS